MSAPFSTPDAVKALAMDVKGIAPQQLLPEALILNITTRAGSVEGDAPLCVFPTSISMLPGSCRKVTQSLSMTRRTGKF